MEDTSHWAHMGQMDHGNMDHGHMGHGDMDMPSQCKMNMIFTWDTTDLCVVFKWWHIRTTVGLWISLIAIVALGAGYEYLRCYTRAYLAKTGSERSERGKVQRGLLYALQVAYSFFLMLVFMTYNGWAMLAVTAGAFLGYYIWGDDQSAVRSMSCH